MTVKNHRSWLTSARFALNQVLIVILINVPTLSFGLALGWVSLASGEAARGVGGAGGDAEAGRAAVVAAVTTFAAALVGVPLSAAALSAGRKVALLGTSACFVVCWSLKLANAWGAWGAWGAWAVVAARVAAGLGGAAAWALSPLLARELCAARYGGAAVSALAAAHNLGVLLMYLAADLAIGQRAVLAGCLALALAHCAALARVPESPSFLAARGRAKRRRVQSVCAQEAGAALAWYRGLPPGHAALAAQLAALPPADAPQSSWSLATEMLSDPRRRRAFVVGAVCVVGQEVCGVLAILQYAERVFVLARDERAPPAAAPAAAAAAAAAPAAAAAAPAAAAAAPAAAAAAAAAASAAPPAAAAAAELASPARYALLLGVVQLVMSVLALYLVERVGRRPLIIWCAAVTGAALAAAACLAGAGAGGGWRGPALGAAVALAVAADAAGLQPAPYALLADMFHYKYRSCALMLASLGAGAGNALEVALFPAAAAAGLRAALALAAALTLAYAAFAAAALPETRGRRPEDIYAALGPAPPPAAAAAAADCERACTAL